MMRLFFGISLGLLFGGMVGFFYSKAQIQGAGKVNDRETQHSYFICDEKSQALAVFKKGATGGVTKKWLCQLNGAGDVMVTTSARLKSQGPGSPADVVVYDIDGDGLPDFYRTLSGYCKVTEIKYSAPVASVKELQLTEDVVRFLEEH